MSNDKELGKICGNCDNSCHGFGESSLHYGLRCNEKEISVSENDSCDLFVVSAYIENKELKKIIEQKNKEIERYKKALEFYASPDFWHYDHITRANVVIARCDRSKANDLTIVCSGGKLARQALSEVDNE